MDQGNADAGRAIRREFSNAHQKALRQLLVLKRRFSQSNQDGPETAEQSSVSLSGSTSGEEFHDACSTGGTGDDGNANSNANNYSNHFLTAESSTGIKRKFVPSARTLGLLKRMATSVSTFWQTRLEESRSAEYLRHQVAYRSSTNDSDMNNPSSSSSPSLNTAPQIQTLQLQKQDQGAEYVVQDLKEQENPGQIVRSVLSSIPLQMSMASIKSPDQSKPQLFIPVFTPVNNQLSGHQTLNFNSLFNCFDQLTGDSTNPLQITATSALSNEQIGMMNSNTVPNQTDQEQCLINDPTTTTTTMPSGQVGDESITSCRNCSEDSCVYAPEIEAVHIQLHSNPIRLIIERRGRIYAELYNFPFDWIGLQSFVVSSRLLVSAPNRNGKTQGIGLGVDLCSLDPNTFQPKVDLATGIMTLTASKNGRPLELSIKLELRGDRCNEDSVLREEDVEIFPPTTENVVWINLFL